MTPTSLKHARRRAERLMVDACTVTRTRKDSHGEPIATTVAGVVIVERDQVYPDPTWPDDHPWKHGPAKRQAARSQEQNPEAGGVTFTTQRYEDHFPVGAFSPAVGDLIEWKSCPNNPDRVGTVDRITAQFEKTSATAMRLPVETGVEEVAS